MSFSSQAMIKVPSRPWIQSEACTLPYPSSKLSVQKFPAAQQARPAKHLPCATKTADTDALKRSSFLSISCLWSVKPCASERGGLDASGQLISKNSCALHVETRNHYTSFYDCSHSYCVFQYSNKSPSL